jgi:hypothetical protein
MADIEKKTKRYPTDLTDEESSQIEPLLPKPARTGHRQNSGPPRAYCTATGF